MRGVDTNRESFWLQYYSGSISGDTALEEAPSPFAIEVNPKLVPNRTLLEIGCGNGRDSCLFASNKLTVCATDICKAGVEITKRKLPAPSCALVAGVRGLPESSVDYAYARFVLHALTEEEQHDLFSWIKRNVKHNFFIETRSLKDARFGKGTEVSRNAFVDSHYRRFMSADDLIQAAARAGLAVEDVIETTPGSGSDGACVLRATIAPL